MSKMKVGDTVRFLNTVGGGIVKGFQNKNVVIVEDEHGFDFPILISECIVVSSSDSNKLKNTDIPQSETLQEEDTPQLQKIDEAIDDKHTETAEGNRITTCLVYLPMDIKSLQNTQYECFFVNDSNYYLFINYMSLKNNLWQSRFTGLIEPNTKLFLEEFNKEELNNIEQVTVQYVAFKHNREYMFKSPVSVELKIDTVKFYKLHSFKENDYFDDDAIVYYITKNDIPEQEIKVSAQDIQQAILEKKDSQRRPRVQKIKKKEDEILEIDLHIHNLLDTTAGMSNKEILDYQMGKFREVMNKYRNQKRKKIVFIHGKGDGVLKNEILKAIRKEYKRVFYQDASFQEYGYGATMVIM